MDVTNLSFQNILRNITHFAKTAKHCIERFVPRSEPIPQRIIEVGYEDRWHLSTICSHVSMVDGNSIREFVFDRTPDPGGDGTVVVFGGSANTFEEFGR